LFAIAQASSCPGECHDLQAATARAQEHADLEEEDIATDYAGFCMQSCSPSSAKQTLCTPSMQMPLDLLSHGAHQMPETGARVAKAEGEKASAMAQEAMAAAAELSAAKAQAAANVGLAQRASMATEVKAELTTIARHAGAYAESAAEAVKKAQLELKEIGEAPKKAAEQAAQEAVRQIQQEEDMNKKVLTFDQHASGELPPAVAASRAAVPYAAAVREAEQVQAAYDSKSAQLKSEAYFLRASSRNVDSDKLDAYEGSKLGGIRAQSHDLLIKSMKKESEAAEASDQARRVVQVVPKYAAAASDAVGRATILESWMPPSLALEPFPAFSPAAAPAAPAASPA